MLRRIKQIIITNVHRSSLEVLYSCEILIKFGFCRWVSEISSNNNFHENPSGGSWVAPCGQTDRRRDVTNLIVTSQHFWARV